jgi:hypothetical protein
MRKRLLIGVIVVVLALGAMGAAFATNVGFSNVGALSLGHDNVKDVDVDFVGYELDTGMNLPVEVNGVYISFTKNIHSDDNSTVIFVSLRKADWTELAYCVALVPASTTLYKDTIYKLPCADGTYADPEDVYYVKVTVGENSAYSTLGGGQDYGEGTGVVDMPGAAP